MLLVIALTAEPARALDDEPGQLSSCGDYTGDPLVAESLRDWNRDRHLVLIGPDAPDLARLWTFIERFPELAGAPRGVPQAPSPGVSPWGVVLDRRAAEALLARLRQSGLFAEIGVGPAPSGDELRVRLVLNPLVASASVKGLRESPEADLLAHFFGAPRPEESDAGREPANRLRFQVWRKRMEQAALEDCVAVTPDADWFASVEGGGGAGSSPAGIAIKPGLLQGGLEAGRGRAVRWLRERGYPHSSVSAAITAAGALELDVDEGRLVSLEVRGVPAGIAAEVKRTLGLNPGDLLSNMALRSAAARLTERYPFLELDTERAPSKPAGSGVRQGERDGRRETMGRGLKSGRVDLGDLFLSWDYQDGHEPGADPGDLGPGSAGNAVEVTGPGQVVLWLRVHRVSADVQWIQLLRHTPGTGFAPGLAATLHRWDDQDRLHLALDGLFAVNTRRSERALPAGAGLLERLSAEEELDALFGLRVAAPRLNLAELGFQLYALTDTNDTWRMSDTNSYLHSALQALPDRDYFRRSGVTALATFHLFERVTLGGEYHRDRFDALPSPQVWSLFNSDVPTEPGAPVTPATLGSVLLRFEYSSDPVALLRVGTLQRHPEVSLSDHSAEPGPTFITLATFEAGSPGLGGDQSISYLKGLSDSRLQLTLADQLWARLRLRLAAGSGLPLQKQEALGGWSALRGYDFKEFRGDASILANAEVRFRFLGGFFDLGSVHAPGGWQGLRPGAGGQLFLRHVGSLEFAWRLDGHGDAKPSARALLGWDL
jgi:hypothetical protein